MTPSQYALLFANWLLFGYLAWRFVQKRREAIVGMSQGKRISLSVILMLSGALVLLGGLFAIERWMPGSRIVGTSQLVALLIIGIIFVWMQALAAAMMTSILMSPETPAPSETSSTQDPGRELKDE